MKLDEALPLSIVDVTQYSTFSPDAENLQRSLTSADFGQNQSKLAPRLNLLIMVVGTWGDIQPFVALAQRLEYSHGHRVRLATNSMYGEFIRSRGLEHYPLGGDPQLLSALMVQNNGIVPSSMADLQREREEYRKIIFSTWGACVNPSIESGLPFRADAMIANPPASGHVHCAQKLGIPLHMIFTMPWSPTKEYPHPFSRLSYEPGRRSIWNWLSYYEIEGFTNTGVIDITNKFREEVLQLEPLLLTDGAATILYKLQPPMSYAWSPSLAPKSLDWGSLIDVVGFMAVDSTTATYDPSAELANFLASGQPPLYIGFGSMLIKDPAKLARVIFSALRKAGMRAVVSRGWAKLGEVEGLPIPPNILLVDTVPHTWLFPRCAAVVHHGGAGTVANGLLAGRPTMVVPFFGDQHFWGQLIWEKGLGPPPVRVEKLCEEKILEGLRFLCRPEVQETARCMSRLLQREDGVAGAAEAFHRHLPVEKIACDLAPSRVARVYCSECRLKLSLVADKVIHEEHSGERRAHHRVPYEAIDWTAQMYSQPWHGLILGLRRLLFQMGLALSGLVLEPYHGWTRGGLWGLLLGLLRAGLSFLCRPIHGCQLFLEGAGTGLKEWAEGRPPKLWRNGKDLGAMRSVNRLGASRGGLCESADEVPAPGSPAQANGCSSDRRSAPSRQRDAPPLQTMEAAEKRRRQRCTWGSVIVGGVTGGTAGAVSVVGRSLLCGAGVLQVLTWPLNGWNGTTSSFDVGRARAMHHRNSDVPAASSSANGALPETKIAGAGPLHDGLQRGGDGRPAERRAAAGETGGGRGCD